MTSDQIRKRILEVVSKNGGHLSPSLGAVEIAIALRETFDPEKDRIVWDVGHQAYAWKLLTGRDDSFDSIRRLGGLSGFTTPLESSCDAAVAGHAGVALSVAEGYATANRLSGSDRSVVAVVGDSSLVNGTSFEAMNFAASAGKVILVLNDNGMSISKPSGSFSRFLGRLIAGARYNRVKNAARAAGRAVGLSFMHGAVHRIKAKLKSILIDDGFFNKFGFRYIGPVDGHDVAALKAAFEVAKAEQESVIVHVVTKKGRGWTPAEANPTKWHGVGPFELGEDGNPVEKPAPAGKPAQVGWSEAFGSALEGIAESDGRIVALTAGMRDGTGLVGFSTRFPSRFFDVGIAEGHMVAFAAGLAQGGMRPVVAVYSTFLQRAVDQIVHDCSIAKVPVVFAVDRAGVVGADGVTHQGVFDIAMLRAVPNLTICQPRDAEDLRLLLEEAIVRNGPTVIRYPRGKAPAPAFPPSGGALSFAAPRPSAAKPPRFAIWATGDWFGRACRIAGELGGVAVHARYIKPFDSALLARQRAEGMAIVSLENGAAACGLGEAIGADLRLGWPDEFIPHGTQAELEEKYGLDEAGAASAIRTFLAGRGSETEES